MVGTAGVVRAKRDVGRGAQSVGAEVVTLLQSSYDVRDYLRTCWRRIERNLPIIVYASVSNFSHSYTSHSFTLSRLVGLVEDELLKLVGSLAFLCHVHRAAIWRTSSRPLGHRLGLASLKDGTLRPLPFQLAPLSSSRPKQPD